MSFPIQSVKNKESGSISPTNISGTITAGNTAQVLAAANTNRRGWYIRNNSTSSLWVSDMTTAVQSQPSLEIKAGEMYEAPAGGVSMNELSIIGSTTGQSWTGREW
jgi:1,2-phenylacetyl-CoA epoxidase PaaB subunit